MLHLISLLLSLLVGWTGAASAASPNILLILTDDQGWSQVSVPMDPREPESKSTYLETPNMARLAEAGMRFTNGYSPAPLCTPTRRSILCGTCTARSGTEFKSPWVPAEHLTIPKALKQANLNYRCAHFGKWGEQMISAPEECGYDASDGMTGNVTGGMPKSLGVESGNHNDGPPHFIDNKDAKRTNTVTDHAIAFMREQVKGGHPFYVQASYYAVHLSVVCREDLLRKYRQKGKPDRGYTEAWAAMMEELDMGVGRLLAALDELGIADSTYVFFTADNGGRGSVPGGSADRLPTNHPLDGAKHSLLEGGIRVPFIVRGPGIAPGSTCHTPVVGYDFLPTFYDLAGGTGELPPEIDGGSIRPLFTPPDTATVKRPLGALIFHRPGRLQSAIRQGEDKLFLTWKRDNTIASRALCRVGVQPRESEHDLSAKEPAKVAALEKKLLNFLKSLDAETVPPAPTKKRKKKKRK